ncbi:MAG: hypothetical protein K8F91_15545 [Candidatus Obscuribacterales bacterium]|nr:hypothetical protein [Candidatus Obscuribacterales bacterium]
MRGRHLPFSIGIAERDAWVRIMGKALDAVPELDEHKPALSEFFSDFATFMINKEW